MSRHRRPGTPEPQPTLPDPTILTGRQAAWRYALAVAGIALGVCLLIAAAGIGISRADVRGGPHLQRPTPLLLGPTYGPAQADAWACGQARALHDPYTGRRIVRSWVLQAVGGYVLMPGKPPRAYWGTGLVRARCATAHTVYVPVDRPGRPGQLPNR